VPRLTNRGAGAGDGLGVASEHEIMVPRRDAEDARKILRPPLRKTISYVSSCSAVLDPRRYDLASLFFDARLLEAR
jgi:hypothetical protein